MALGPQLGLIGVDVGTCSVKIAQAIREGGTVRLHRAAVIQRSSSWSGSDSFALDQPASSQNEIRAALECGRFSGRNAVCTLPMNICQLRALKVPPGSDRERRTIIGDELAEDWSELRQPMQFDFWELESGDAPKGSDGSNVSVLAASRLWVDQLWRDCRRNGLDCWGIDGTPLAMARAVALAGGASGGRRVLAIDWGFSNTTLCAVGDGRPLYSRRIHDCGLGLVFEAIMHEFDVTLDEAQHLVETQGLETDDPDEIADGPMQAAITDAASKPLEELIRQVRRTLEFMDTQRRQLHPTAIWLMGGGGSMRNVDRYLAAVFRLPVHRWQLPDDESCIPCAAGSRAAVFSGAMALSATLWRAA